MALCNRPTSDRLTAPDRISSHALPDPRRQQCGSSPLPSRAPPGNPGCPPPQGSDAAGTHAGRLEIATPPSLEPPREPASTQGIYSAGSLRVSRCSNALRFASDSPRDTRHSYSRRIDDAKPISSSVLKSPSAASSDLAEHAVQLVRGHRVQAHPADQVDVARPGRSCSARRRASRCAATGSGTPPRAPRPAGGTRTPRRPSRARRPAASSWSAASWSPAASRSTGPARGGRSSAHRSSSAAVISASSWSYPLTPPLPCRRPRAGTRPRPRRSPPPARRSCGPTRTRLACATAPAANRSRTRGSQRDPGERVGPGGRLVPAHQQTGRPVRDRHRQPADRGRDDRRAARLRLERDEPERLVVAGHRDDVGRPVHVDQRRAPAAAAGTAPRRRCRASRPAPAATSAPPAPCRTARRPPRPTSRSRGTTPRASSSAAADSSTSGAFSGWIRPTNASTTASRRMPSAARAAARSPGANRSRSTPGATVLTFSRRGAVEVDELARLDRGVGDQLVGLVDHLLLADHPGPRLRRVAGGQRGGS